MNEEKVDIAALYRELSKSMAGESKEVKKILNKIKKASAKGMFTIKIYIDRDIYHWLSYRDVSSISGGNKTKPDLIARLEDLGFWCGKPNFETSIFKPDYSMIISWR